MAQQHSTELRDKSRQRKENQDTRSAVVQPLQPEFHRIQQLQRTLGNREVAKLIQAKRLTPAGKIIGLQPKLTVGAADDQYEQEADRVANQVMTMPEVTAAQQNPLLSGQKDQSLQTKPLAASITPVAQRQTEKEQEVEEDQDRDEEKDLLFQAKLSAASVAPSLKQDISAEEDDPEPIQLKTDQSLSGSFDAGNDIETQLSLSKGRGSPLPEAVRNYMEPRFGADFSQVRVHTDSESLQMNQAVGAQAFTHGSDIYFGEGRSPTNLELTAHELTHVVQQTGKELLHTKTHEPADAALARENLSNGSVLRLPKANAPHSTYAASEETATSHSKKVNTAFGWLVADRELLAGHSGLTSSGVRITRREVDRSTDADANSTVRSGPKDNELVGRPPALPVPLVADIAPAEHTPTGSSTPTAPSLQIPTSLVASPPGAEERAPSAPASIASTPSVVQPDWASPPEGLISTLESLQPLPTVTADFSAGFAPVDEVARSGSAAASVQADGLMQEAQALSQSVGSTGEAVQAALAAEVTRLADLAHTQAAQARADLSAAYGTQQALMQAETQISRAIIDQSSQQQQQTVTGIAMAERERLRTAHQAERQTAIDFVEGLKAAILMSGEEQAQRATVESENRAEIILAESQQVPVTGDPPVIEAQQQAAQQIAERTADQCRQTGNDLAGRLHQETENYAASDYDTGLQDYLAQLDQQMTDAETAIDEFVSQAYAQIDAIASDAVEAVQEISGQSIAALDAEQAAAETQIAAWETQVPETLQTTGNQLRRAFDGQLVSFAEALVNYGVSAAAQVRRLSGTESIQETANQVRQSLRAGHDEAMGGVSAWQNSATQELGSAFDGLCQQLTGLVAGHNNAVVSVGSKLIQGFQQVAQSAQSDMEASTVSFTTHLGGSIDSAIQQMTDAGAEFRAKLQENQVAVTMALSRLVDDALTAEDNLLADARAEMAEALPQIAGRYQELQAEAQQRDDAETESSETRIYRSIWSSITEWWSDFTASVKKWFADTFGKFWGGLLYGILETLVIVVVGALAIWAAAAGIAALLAAVAGITVAVAKVALIIGVVLLVVVIIPLLIYNRVQEYRQDNPGKEIDVLTGIGLGLLGIADVTGLPFIIEAAVGKRATGGELHGWDRGFRLGQGIVMLAAVIFSAYRFFKGSTAPAEPVRGPPEIRPPEPVPPEVRPPGPVPPEPVPPEVRPPEPVPPEFVPPEPVPPEPTPPTTAVPRSWAKFKSEFHAIFRARLKVFRGNNNLEPDFGGGEGKIFANESNLALKRWFAKILDSGKAQEGIQLLENAKAAVDANPSLARDIEVVRIHEKGPDWILRDFDPNSLELRDGGARAQSARARTIAELEAMQRRGELTQALKDILKKLKKEPPSANLHWSEARGKIIVIDMR